MNIRYILFSFIIMCGALASTSVYAVSDWALQRARERLAAAKTIEETVALLSLAQQIEKEESAKETLKQLWMAFGYCTYAAAKGTWFVAKNAVKVAAFATASTVKTAYYAVANPDELRDKIEHREVEPIVGIACLSGILIAAIAQVVNAATH
jgi:glycyl-tRNA synthetase (class II)